jgi:hypothetical protein
MIGKVLKVMYVWNLPETDLDKFQAQDSLHIVES